MTKKSIQIINLILIVVYIFCSLLAGKFGINWLKLIPGIFMLYYLPGYNLNEIVLKGRENFFSWYGRISIDIVSSLTIVYIFYTIFNKFLGYSENAAIVFVVILNLVLFIGSWFINRKNGLDKKFKFVWNKENKIIVGVLIFPIAMFFLRLALNPYVYEIDSGLYFDIYNQILKSNVDQSFLAGLRNGFTLFMIYSNYVLGLGFIGFFKFFTPLLFNISAFIFLDICLKIKNKKVAYLAYLLILTAPILAIMNEGVRPETFIYVYTLPIMALIYWAVELDDFVFGVLALIFAANSFRFHEFGVFLFGMVIFSILIMIIKRSSNIVNFAKKYPVKFSLIIIPYLILAKLSMSMLWNAFGGGIFHTTLVLLGNWISDISWRWWFINNYTAIDGGKIGWPGYSFILYYLYNGLSLLCLFGLIIGLCISLKKNKIKIFLPLLPAIGYLLVYFSIAEVLPRMGIYLLPNRTWPHIMLSMTFIIVILLSYIESCKPSILKNKWIISSLWICIGSGVIGAVVGSTMMGSVVVPAEKKVISQMRSLPDEAIVVSTQPNKNLVEMYGNKSYIEIKPISYKSEQNIKDNVLDNIKDYRLNLENLLLSKIDISVDNRSVIVENGIDISIDSDSVRYIEDKMKLEYLHKYDKGRYETIMEQSNKYLGIENRPVYFVYSFAKFDGIIAMRDWWVKNNDKTNFNFFKSYKGDNVFYKDNNAILIQIK